MNRLVRTIAAPVLAAAVALSAGVVAAGPASALTCVTCDPGGTGGGGGGGSTPPAPTPIASTGVGGAGNAYAWQALNGPSDRFLSVHVHTNPIDGHSAWWMDDTATLDKQTGTVQLSGTIEDDQLFVGFTGGVHVIGMDDYGNVLAQTSVNAAGVADDPAWGVCGKWELVCPYSRPLGASLPMTGDFKDVTHLLIVNWHDSQNRLGSDLQQLANLIGSLISGLGGAATIAGLFGH